MCVCVCVVLRGVGADVLLGGCARASLGRMGDGARERKLGEGANEEECREGRAEGGCSARTEWPLERGPMSRKAKTLSLSKSFIEGISPAERGARLAATSLEALVVGAHYP